MIAFPHIQVRQRVLGPSLTEDAAAGVLQNDRIPAVIENGATSGLDGYLPALVKTEGKPLFLPDLIELAICRKPFAPPFGPAKKPNPAAIRVDDRPNLSAEDSGFTQYDVKFGSVYASLSGENAIWQGGTVLMRVHLRKYGLSKFDDDHYKDSLAHYLKYASALSELVAHVVRVEKDYFVEYLFVKGKELIDPSLVGLADFSSEDLVGLALEDLDDNLESWDMTEPFQTTRLSPLTLPESPPAS